MGSIRRSTIVIVSRYNREVCKQQTEAMGSELETGMDVVSAKERVPWAGQDRSVATCYVLGELVSLREVWGQERVQ